MTEPRSQNLTRADDGIWEPATPLGFQGRTLDFEVNGSGPWRWEAYRGPRLVAAGTARTRMGLAVALWWTKLRAGTPSQEEPTP